MDDILYQLGFVKEACGRLLRLQDGDPSSPTYGCFDPNYWRDKTADFPDARKQEAGAAAGLLLHPGLYGEGLPPRRELYRAFMAGARFWGKIQHREGSFDEWYKGERGFAATAFSLNAYGWALDRLGPAVAAQDRRAVLGTAVRAGDWLLRRDDPVKTNHEAAAAAALAVLHRLTGEARFLEGARRKSAAVLASQTPEGWFPEVGGMDLGYSGLLLDCMMLYHRAAPDTAVLPAMRRLYAFLYAFLQPDLTVSAAAGLCRNDYVSRLGTLLLAPHCAPAAAVAGRFLRGTNGFAGLAPYLSDDLRLSRWAVFPCLAALCRAELEGDGSFWTALDREAPARPASAFFPMAAAGSLSEGAAHVVFFPAGGGVVRACFSDPEGGMRVFEDLGYRYEAAVPLCTAGYSLDRPREAGPAGLACEVDLAPARFFNPPFAARLLLRLACLHPAPSRWARRLIDRYRLRNSTALNQSSAPLAGVGAFFVQRRVSLRSGVLTIEDRFGVRDRRAVLDVRRLSTLGSDGPRGVDDFMSIDEGCYKAKRVQRISLASLKARAACESSAAAPSRPFPK